ncbi:DUF2125 domain-containing protein [Frigidibacter sp. MR17.24]|uniref:DUF2125 domain-containing protein n=1 Tax=Frigidibacter sp. MR17.24 TaxID=3127345 RepID=UPI003012D77D
MATPFPRSLKAMIWLLALLALGWSAYWVAGSRLVLQGARAALAQAVAAGRADPAELSIAGFPNRFDLTAQPIVLRSAGNWAEWQAPRIDLYALGWRPNRVIFDLPAAQRLRLGRLSARLQVAAARGSVAVGFSPALPLEQAVLVTGPGEIRAEAAAAEGPITAFDSLRLATRATDATGLRQQLGLEIANLALPAAVQAQMGALPARIDRLHADVTVTLPAPIDRAALSGPLPRPQAFEVTDLSLALGPATLAASGQLSLGADGVLDGALQLEAANWNDLLTLAVASGLVDRDIARTYGRALDGLAQLTGARDGRLQVPLTISKGFMSLGPLPLGPAPRLPPAQGL